MAYPLLALVLAIAFYLVAMWTVYDWMNQPALEAEVKRDG